jgi:hypothetical protein
VIDAGLAASDACSLLIKMERYLFLREELERTDVILKGYIAEALEQVDKDLSKEDRSILHMRLTTLGELHRKLLSMLEKKKIRK